MGAMTFLEAALEILKRERKPLHYKDITTKAMDKKLLTFVGRTPEVTMQTQLTAAVKKTPGNPFVRVKPGTFGLLRYPEAPASPPPEEAVQDKSEDTADEAAAGAGGAEARARRRRRGGRGRGGRREEGREGATEVTAATARAQEDSMSENDDNDTSDSGEDQEPEIGGKLSAEARAAALAESGVLEALGDDQEDDAQEDDDEDDMEDDTSGAAGDEAEEGEGEGEEGDEDDEDEDDEDDDDEDEDDEEDDADEEEARPANGTSAAPSVNAAAGKRSHRSSEQRAQGGGGAGVGVDSDADQEGDDAGEGLGAGMGGEGGGTSLSAGGEQLGEGAQRAPGAFDDSAGGRRRRRRRRRRGGGPGEAGFGGGPEDSGNGNGNGNGGPRAEGAEAIAEGSEGAPLGAAPAAEGAPASFEGADSSAGRRIMSPVDAAIEILRGQAPGRGMHVRQLADAATRRRLVHGEANEAWRVMRAALAAEPRERLRAGQRPRVRAAGSGLFALSRRPPDLDLERAEHVFGEARRALRERTLAGLEQRLVELAPSGFEAIARVLLQREGFGPATFVKRVEGTVYLEALRGRGIRPSRTLIALRPGGAAAGRRAIGELRAGIRARNQDEGVLLLGARLAEDGIAEWKQPGPPIEVADGAALAETCLRHGVGVINTMVSVDFVDADFFAELQEG
jgi:hypothetical protein